MMSIPDSRRGKQGCPLWTEIDDITVKSIDSLWELIGNRAFGA